MTPKQNSIAFRKMNASDWPKVAEIYAEGLATGHSSFQEEIPLWEEWDIGHKKCCRILAIYDNEIVGWAALSPTSSRKVYEGVAEVSLYVAKKFQGQKIGLSLLKELINESEENYIWTLQASIFPENKASIQVHTHLGFRILGFREKIGELNGKWRDTMILERRSQKVGLEKA